MTDTTKTRIGMISMSGKDVDHTARCNALAFNPKIDGYELMLLSVVGPSTTLKSIQAALNSRVKVTFKPDDIPGMGHYFKMYRAKCSYRIFRYRMGYQTWHLLAVANEAGLLTESSDESVWRVLQGGEITTPMLRGWVPYIKQRLIAEGLLTPLRCYGCDASIVSATVDQVDEIVSRGIRYEHLRLENQQHDCPVQ